MGMGNETDELRHLQARSLLKRVKCPRATPARIIKEAMNNEHVQRIIWKKSTKSPLNHITSMG